MTKAKKSNGRAKRKAETKFEAFEVNGARKQVSHALARVQEGFREAGEAIREAGETFGDEGRKVALTIVGHAQDNVVHSFEALRETLLAETLADAVKVQQHAITEMWRRSLRQMREVGEIVTHSSTQTLKPISKFVSSLRDQRNAA